MIQKLRRSFVRVTMLSAALVLIVLMGLVNLLNYIQRDNADRAILSYLAESGGLLPSAEMGRGGRGGHGQPTVQDIYGAGYFTVSLSGDGELLHCDTSRTPWLRQEDAAEKARAVQSAGRISGRYGDYKFIAVSRGTDVLYIFLTWSQNMAAMRSFFINSLMVTVGGLAVLFLLAWLFADRAVRPIAESYEKQKSFITNAGHELKTPLAVIESSADVIELENGGSRWTQSIHSQVERLSNLTQELIALARMDEGSAKPPLEELDISGIVAETLEPFSLVAERQGLSFAADIQPGIRLSSNRDALEKICAILADNAVKYTAPGGTIRFTLAKEGGHVVYLREENPAAGLTPGRQERLFDRFYRGDESRNSEHPGYGLGLSLARSLAESLGGSITAASPDGKKLVMSIRLN